MAETCRDLACMKCESDYCHCCKYPMEEADKVEKIVRADERSKVIEPLIAGFKDLVELQRLMVRYFEEVDLKSEKTELEKLALEINTQGMQTVGYFVEQLEQIKEQSNE